MTRSLVVCLCISAAAAASAAALCLVAGGGAVAALAVYSAVGSLSLVGLTLAAAACGSRAARGGPLEADRPAYA